MNSMRSLSASASVIPVMSFSTRSTSSLLSLFGASMSIL